jgi:hypothetical protein
VKFAETCHAYGQLVERPTEIKEALKNAFDSGRPSIIDLRIDPDEVPAGALKRFETLVKKHPELGEKRIPTTTFPKKATQRKTPLRRETKGNQKAVEQDSNYSVWQASSQSSTVMLSVVSGLVKMIFTP